MPLPHVTDPATCLPACLPVEQSLKSPQKPKMGDDDMAAVINDGLELYARELQQVRVWSVCKNVWGSDQAGVREKCAGGCAGIGPAG